jgi:hypothetical protein
MITSADVAWLMNNADALFQFWGLIPSTSAIWTVVAAFCSLVAVMFRFAFAAG